MKQSFLLLCFYANILLAQQTGHVDFKTCTANLNFKPTEKMVSGSVVYTFKILKDVDSVYLDAKRFKQVSFIFKDAVYHEYDGEYIVIKNNFLKGQDHQVKINFIAQPQKAIYFLDWESPLISAGQIWTQGQGKYTSNWLPSIDDMNDKIEFDLSITFDSDYEVIANGKLINKEVSKLSTTWHYNMKKPMSSYLVALAIGKYNKKVEYSKRGVPLEMYYYPKDSLKFEPTYRYSKDLFDFLEEEIGVPYPWQNYKQIPVKDFLYAGMENTSTTIFSDAFVIDSIAFVDKNYVNVNAHELAHQWFGDLVTETSGAHHWLQEGFATYYALLAERHIFGEDHYHWQLYEYMQELLDQDQAGFSTSLLDPKSSSTTFYKKGAWVLHVLRQQIGDAAFKKGVKNYILEHQYKNVETTDFIKALERASGSDLSEFVNLWLVNVKLPYLEMQDNLIKSSAYIKNYLEIDCLNKAAMNCKNLLLTTISDEAKIKIIRQNSSIIEHVNFNNSIKIRQAIAQSLSKIPLALKDDYESLLNDKSYTTIEMALFALWQNYPNERSKYLNKTKGITGFNDKNIRILWLTLALITDAFEVENKQLYFDELISYTSPNYGFEIRQNAFQYLDKIQACNVVCKKNLEQATTHHNWRFSKFANTLLNTK